MGIIKQLIRSSKKSKVMADAIREEVKVYDYLYDDDKAQIARKALYDYLCKDEILSALAREFTFDQFNDSISYLKAMGLKYSKSGDFVPIAAFCFMRPLAFSIGYFIEKEYDWNEYLMFLTSYFGEMVY